MRSLTRYAARSAVRTLSLLLALISLAGCGPNHPDPSGLKDFTQRALVQRKDGVTVRTSVLTDEECRRYFGGSTADVDVQPVWIQIQNDNDKPLRYLPIFTDPDYFAPQEVAQRLHGWFSFGRNAAIDELFEDKAIGNYVPGNQTVSGFLYTHENGGLKFLTFGLIGAERHWLFRFIVPVTGVQYAVQSVDFSKLYPAGTIEDLSLDEFRKRLESLPCCVTSKTGRA